ncbi:DNA-processing protein DprA [Streptomyces sp. 110]|uniref:DNA-processing protein DprA n=1 Tax=Streptomyces endocoffeicus TaxID=2898945 RepID=A0ABS1Q2E3_9ACTN|nr:DNA-processing protein DprA [Streptomyces endocoffeicus]MBL1118828.1 DNA-processing protein DprA [Streptomyces endocoffeicus]
MPLAVTITGTRSTGHREMSWYAQLFASYLGPFAEDQAHFHVGGAKGIDSLTLLWIAGNAKSKITIVVPGTVAQQPAEARQAISQCRSRIAEVVELRAEEVRTPAYHARNRWMVDRSDMVIGFPKEDAPETSGTWQTLNYGTERGKPRLIVPV